MKTTTAYDGYTYYEAEAPENELSGNAAVGTNQFASGMKQVINIGQTASNKITFTKVEVPEDGVYEMRLYYACGVERRVVYCANGEEEIRSCKLNAGVNTLAMERFYVRLKKGTNQISFGNNSAKAPNLDRIAISNKTVDEKPTVTDLTDDGGQSADGPQYEYTIYGLADATVEGGAKKEGNAIGWLGLSASSIVKYNVNVAQAGNYKLQINYFAGESRRAYVSVNGGTQEYYDCPSTGSYTIDSSESIYVDVSLKEGSNTIQLGNPTEWCPNIVSIGVSKTVVAKSEQKPQEQIKTVAPKAVLVKAKGYELSCISLVKGRKVKLAVSVSPKKANQKVVFSSNNKSVAAVNNLGVVHAKKAGKAKITIATKDGTKKKVVVIQVQKGKVANQKLSLKKAQVTLKKKKQTAQIAVKALTKNTTDQITYKVVSWKKYIKVDAYGKVTVIRDFAGSKTANVLVRCGKAEKVFKVLLKR